jgi:aminoglycoside phosphotransferase (APT) family kinase protein
VLLEEWIEGETLGACPDGARLVEAAALLADLHATAHVAGRPVHERRGTQDWSAAADRGLHEILAAGEIDASSARRVRAAVARLDPGSATHGLVHSDFCGENLVVDRAGRLRVIDNERVRLAPLGFDLGRTWYRWSLPPRAWERFWNAYAARSAFRDPLDTLPFFRLVAVVKSAALRLRMDPTRAQDPLRRLRELANDLALQSSLGATAP